MAKAKHSKAADRKVEQIPEWFLDEGGNRLGVLENERARGAWYAEHGVPDPAKVSAARVAARSKGVDPEKG